MGKSVVFKSALAPEKKTSWWPVVAVFVAVLALAGGLIWLADATSEPAAAPEPEPATVADYTVVVLANSAAIEESAADDLCMVDIVLEPHGDDAAACIELASSALGAMQDIKDRFDALGWPTAPAEISEVGSLMYRTASVMTDDVEGPDVAGDCVDPSADECSATVGTVHMVMRDSIEPQLDDWELLIR